MKYQIHPNKAQFNEDGFVINEGWALVYNADSITGEFLNSTYEYLAEGIGIPSHVCLTTPKEVDDKHAIVRFGDEWTYPSDYRGQKIYSTETGIESIMNEIGDIPNSHTLLAPTSQFDSWNGNKWVLDTAKQHQHYVDIATAQKNELISEATANISYLQDAVDAEIATEEETTALAAWKKYRVLLNRIDIEKAQNIDWPIKP